MFVVLSHHSVIHLSGRASTGEVVVAGRCFFQFAVLPLNCAVIVAKDCITYAGDTQVQVANQLPQDNEGHSETVLPWVTLEHCPDGLLTMCGVRNLTPWKTDPRVTFPYRKTTPRSLY